MITFDIKYPRFVQEVLERHRSLIVNFGRIESNHAPSLSIFFQGNVVHNVSLPGLHTKPLDGKHIASKLVAISEGHAKAEMTITSKEAGRLVALLTQSELIHYFCQPAEKRKSSVTMMSNHRQVWNPQKFEFEEAFTEGRLIQTTYQQMPDWSGYTPPESMKKKRVAVSEQTAEETEEQILKTLDFWLFGPVI